MESVFSIALLFVMTGPIVSGTQKLNSASTLQILVESPEMSEEAEE